MSLADRYRQYLRDAPPLEEDEADEQVDLLEVANAAFVEAARNIDPSAALEAGLDLRVTGERITSGALTFDVASALFHQVQAEVREAVPSGEDKSAVELEFIGVGHGSAVVHARPATEIKAPEGSLNLSASVLDSAMSRVLDLHDALETDDELGHDSALLDRLRKLTKDMDKFGVNLDVAWTGTTGRRRRSVISERGRSRARTLFERDDESTVERIAGNVFGVSLDGELSLRMRAKNGRLTTVKVAGVDRETLTSGQLALERYVRVEVRRQARKDRAGTYESHSYQWVRLLSHEDPLSPEEESTEDKPDQE